MERLQVILRVTLLGVAIAVADFATAAVTAEEAAQLKTTLTQVNTLLDKMNNGQGAISRLLNDPTIAEDLDGVMRETQGLLKDFRSNPKKFLHIKLSLF